jgi:hypothetical protein
MKWPTATSVGTLATGAAVAAVAAAAVAERIAVDVVQLEVAPAVETAVIDTTAVATAAGTADRTAVDVVQVEVAPAAPSLRHASSRHAFLSPPISGPQSVP